MRIIIYISIFIFIGYPGIAQNEIDGKTIDITSSFKPTLIPPKKIIPATNPFRDTNPGENLQYDVPSTLLNFKYVPSPLRPLAFKDTSSHVENRGYIKVGYGNFSTPFLKAALNYGNGETINGNLEGFFTSSKGNLPFQDFTKYGLKTNTIFQVDDRFSLQGRAGISGQALYRYGFRPDTLKPNADSLKLNYNDIHLGATVGNNTVNDLGLFYKADIDANFFTDNQNGRETSLAFEAPVEKEINNELSLIAGLGGLLSGVKVNDTSFSNNLIMLKAGAEYRVNENMTWRAMLMPSWNNGSFHLLPMATVEVFLPKKQFTLEAGIVGGFVRNTWRSLATFNPWMAQPKQITHSRNIEYAFSLKGNLDEHWFFRLKASVNSQSNVPLFVNDSLNGNSFDIIWEPSMLITGGTGELVYQSGDRFSWNTQFTVRGFSGLEKAEKAFGLIPFEIQSSLRAKFFDRLFGKLDFYHFYAPWNLVDVKANRGGGGLDMNLGAEYRLKNKLNLWLQFNNLFNDTYERWNQFPVLGFQVTGGVIFKF